MPIGQTAAIGDELTIKFVDVTEDSRCPTGVDCIQAGRAVCRLDVTSGGQTSSVTLSETGGGPVEQTVGVYQFKFDVTPYPQAGKAIAKSSYKLVMTVTK